MKISEQQLMVIFETAKACIRLHDKGYFLPYRRETLIKVIEDIVNQQSTEIIDVKDKNQ